MFKEVFSRHKKVLIPYLTAGVPTLAESQKLASALIEEGARIIELGVPFSDPSADGPVLQKASELALKNGVTLKDVLKLASQLSQKHPTVPIVLFTYLNPLLAFGLENYVREAKDSGVAATLTVDLPPEEAHEYVALHRSAGLEMVFLASPTTTPERLKLIHELSTPFVYYVSRAGVTGERSELSTGLPQEVYEVRKICRGPLAVGFGISTPEQARQVSELSDAVVIGSAFVRLLLEIPDEAGRETAVREMARSFARAIE